jgi:hypothetical protein
MSHLDRREGEGLQEYHDRLAGMDTSGVSIWAMRDRALRMEKASADLGKAAAAQAGPPLAGGQS